MNNIEELKHRIEETPKYLYLMDRANHEHVIIWNQLAIMNTQIEILEKLKKLKHL